MRNVILSAFADEYDASLSGQIEGLGRFGIDHMEFRMVEGRNLTVFSPEEVREAKKRLDDGGISVSAIGSPLGKIRLDEDMNAHLEAARRVYEAANILGAKYIRMFSFYAPKGEDITEKKGQVFDALEKLLVLAREYGVTLCHENEALIYGDVPARCREIFDYFGGEMKCVFDMGNFVLEGVDPYPEAYELLKKDIAYFHIKDALAQGAIVPPGRGDAKIQAILSAHREYAKEDFFVSLEPHLQTFSGLNALVGRSFENPYKYENEKVAFTDAVNKLKEMI